MKPKIGFNTDVFVEDSGRTVTRMNILYSDLIIQHGGIPVIFPPGVLPQEVASGLDGFFLIGGDDYKCSLPASGEIPDRYLEVHPRREETDLNWASWLIKSDLHCPWSMRWIASPLLGSRWNHLWRYRK